MPYRIENTEGLNVFLRLKFTTPRSLRTSNVHLVNRFMHRLRLERFCEQRIDGLSASLKHALASLIVRYDRSSGSSQPDPTFVLNANLSGGDRSLNKQADHREPAPVPGITSFSGNILPASASVVLEN